MAPATLRGPALLPYLTTSRTSAGSSWPVFPMLMPFATLPISHLFKTPPVQPASDGVRTDNKRHYEGLPEARMPGLEGPQAG